MTSTRGDLRDGNVTLEALWYLAPITSLRSILWHGLLSHNDVASRGLAHERIDWTSVQSLRDFVIEFDEFAANVHDRVPLFFSTHQPMLYVQPDTSVIAHLEIDPSVIRRAGVIFTDGNAAASTTAFYCDLSDLDKLDWNVIATPNCYSKEYKRKKAAEVLVPSPLGTASIRCIHVKNDDAARLCRKHVSGFRVPIRISPDLYDR
jgi:hypothetical protein